jgi:AcrR family transcriptional regulator
MTRDDILDAAAQVFSEKGFHGASMQDVAAAVNLQKASLYHHVTSKQEILLALLEGLHAYEHIAGVATAAPADEKLRLMIGPISALSEYPDLSSVLFDTAPWIKKPCRHVPRAINRGLWRKLF